TFYSNSALRGSISAAGNWTINAPSSGADFTAGRLYIQRDAGFAGNGANVYTVSTDPLYLGTTGSAAFNLYTASVQRMAINTTGNVSITSPSSGYPLYVEGDVRAHLPSASNSTFRGVDFGIIGDSTSYGNIGMNMTTGEMRHRAGFG